MNIDKEQKEVDHVEKGTDLWDEKPPAPHQTWMERAFPGGYIPEFKKTISIAWAMVSLHLLRISATHLNFHSLSQRF